MKLFIVICMMSAGVFAGSFTEAFNTPNREARPWCYWWWQNGNATKESITADLESMKALGFGGTLLSDSRVYPKGAELEKPDFPFWHDIASFEVKADAGELVKRGWFEAGDGTRTQHAGINNSTGAKKWYREDVGEEYTVRFGWTTIPGHEYDADLKYFSGHAAYAASVSAERTDRSRRAEVTPYGARDSVEVGVWS